MGDFPWPYPVPQSELEGTQQYQDWLRALRRETEQRESTVGEGEATQEAEILFLNGS